MKIATPILLAITLGLVSVVFGASAVSAGPVEECQKTTGNEVETGQCLQDTLSTVNAVLDSAFVNAQAAADELDAVTGRPAARQALERSESAWSDFRTIN